MKLEFNDRDLRDSMTMWREAVDMQIPMRDDLRIHFLARRCELLDGFVKVANNWSTLLRSCKATGADLIALGELKEEIDQFKRWAENGISELAQLAAAEIAKDKKQ